MKNSKRTLSYKTKESLTARVFMLPFYIGFLMFSLKPLVETFVMVFNKVNIVYGGYEMDYVGSENINIVFYKDPDFLLNLFTSVGNMFWQVPTILFVSLFLAVLLNGNFKGRGFVRSVFFLPVIVVTGIVILIIQNDVVASAALQGEVVAGGKIEYNVGIDQLLVVAGFPQKIVSFFKTLTSNMFNLLWRSGIQIVLFLAGLQSIPTSLYEASSVEGATALDDFFKITLPMTLPIIIINTIYTIVDGFTDVSNLAMNQVMVAVSGLNFGVGAAMSWSYFALISVFILLVMLIFTKLSKKYS